MRAWAIALLSLFALGVIIALIVLGILYNKLNVAVNHTAGPQGPIGPTGEIGFEGNRGFQGFQGI